MESKFSIGQYVVIKKGVYFHSGNEKFRSGEVGQVVEVDLYYIDGIPTAVHDYIIKIRGLFMFFYEEELAPYPERSDK
tara:strand:- start:104 stop:337 length:234 start_codon:yes stop_codon:yes gene_type:complete